MYKDLTLDLMFVIEHIFGSVLRHDHSSPTIPLVGGLLPLPCRDDWVTRGGRPPFGEVPIRVQIPNQD